MISLENENLQNGYIYEKLSQKIDSLDSQNKEIMKLINEASSNNRISMRDYVSIIKEIRKMNSRDEFDHHVKDEQMHCSGRCKLCFINIDERLKTIEERLGITSNDNIDLDKLFDGDNE